MADLATLRSQVDERVADLPQPEFDDDKREEAVEEAFGFYAQHRTETVIETIAGSDVFDLTLPATFDQDESIMDRVEYPAGQRVPCYLPDSEWTVYDDGTNPKLLRLFSETPATGEDVIVTFSAPYTLLSMPVNDEYAVLNLACSYICDWAAAFYSTSQRSTIAVDSAEHLLQEQSFHESAKRFRDIAFELLGFGQTAGQDGRSRGSGGSGSGGGPSSPASETVVWGRAVSSHGVRLTRV